MEWLKKFYKVLLHPFQPWFLGMLFVINCLGSVYGYYWYRYQLAETPWYFLPFVPDSPLSSTLFSLVLLIMLLGKRNSLLELLAYLWVIKYGIWAVFINLDAGRILGEFTWENWMLALSHLGMAVEGFLFLPHLKFPKFYVLIMAVWLAINDFVDYGLDQHPYLFDPTQLNLAQSLAIVLSIGLTALAAYYYQKKKLV